MVTDGPALVSVDLDHGGRWTSLRVGGREWLWSRDEPLRAHVVPGDPFADAGGIEECVPTVRGRPDHGNAWSRTWRDSGDGAAEVGCDDFTLRVPGNPAVRLYPEAAAFTDGPWPPGAPFLTVRWPGPGGLRLDRLGPDDGSAVGAIVRGCAQVTVCDSGPALRMRLNAGDGSPTSVAQTSVGLWRNLGGFPDGRPYRSIGVEPMLGSVFDLAEAREPGDAVTVPQAGHVEWELEIEEVTVDNATTEATP
jgi:hypothetical protein